MVKHMLKVILISMLIFATLGCATQHEASYKSFPEGVLTGAHSSETVALVNSQTDTASVEVGTAGLGRSLRGNFAQWTDAAIEVLHEKLTESGVMVSEEASKKLSLMVTDAKMSSAGGGWGFKCAVTLSVETPDGTKADFVGERGSYSYVRVCDAGISEAVANLLRDERMRKYLGY